MAAIHQLLPTVSEGDAISNEAFRIQALLRAEGYESEIFADLIDATLKGAVQSYSAYQPQKQNILLFHLSIGSPVTEFFCSVPDKKAVVYHNITPPEYFEGINEDLASLTRQGREELPQVVQAAHVLFADSEYNKRELEAAGAQGVHVLPLLLDWARYASIDPEVFRRFEGEVVNILSVGKLARNKKPEDVIKAFAYYQTCFNPRSRLFLAGYGQDTQPYVAYLRRLVAELQLREVYFLGGVSQAALNSYFRLADVYVSMSEHEGFCIPLVESLYFQVPIVAYRAAAVPFTLQDAGVLVTQKDFRRIAALLHLILTDASLRAKILEGQAARLQHFTSGEHEWMFLSLLKKLEASEAISTIT